MTPDRDLCAYGYVTEFLHIMRGRLLPDSPVAAPFAKNISLSDRRYMSQLVLFFNNSIAIADNPPFLENFPLPIGGTGPGRTMPASGM